MLSVWTSKMTSYSKFMSNKYEDDDDVKDHSAWHAIMEKNLL